jgi:hypothetical protein
VAEILPEFEVKNRRPPNVAAHRGFVGAVGQRPQVSASLSRHDAAL